MRSNEDFSELLWVEGKDDEAVVVGLCAAHMLPRGAFAIVPKGGVEKVLSGLPVQLRAPAVKRFGIVVDANGSSSSRWEAIRGTLLREGYADVPEALPTDGLVIPAAGDLPIFGAWIMPDNRSPGAIEEFVAALVPAGDWLWKHADEVVHSIPAEHRRFPDSRRAKAHIRTWLSWQEQPGSPMGQAIGKRDLDAHAPAALRFVDWLRRLMISDEGAREGAEED